MSDDQHWSVSALCAQTDPDLWYPERDRNANWQSKKARQICAKCPVAEPCLADALTRADEPGVWGNTTVRERRRLAGRAPKDKT